LYAGNGTMSAEIAGFPAARPINAALPTSNFFMAPPAFGFADFAGSTGVTSRRIEEWIKDSSRAPSVGSAAHARSRGSGRRHRSHFRTDRLIWSRISLPQSTRRNALVTLLGLGVTAVVPQHKTFHQRRWTISRRLLSLFAAISRRWHSRSIVW
jgi:hypothetical protein